MAFMQRAASLHAIPSQITVVVDGSGSRRRSSNHSMEAFFLSMRMRTICTIAFYKNIMITSFYEWRDVSFLYGKLVWTGREFELVFVCVRQH